MERRFAPPISAILCFIASLGLDEALDKVSLKYELWIFCNRKKCIMIFFEIKISDFFGAYFFAEKSNDNDEAGSRNAVTVVELERMMFVGRIKSGLHWFSDKICFVLVVAEKSHGKTFRSSDFCHTLCIATLGLDEALDKVSLKYELWIFLFEENVS